MIKKNGSVRWLGAMLVAFSFVAAACGSSNESSSETTAASTETGSASNLPATITLGSVDSLSGPAAFCGINEVEGMKLAIKVATEEGILGSTTIDLQVADDASTSEGSVAAYRQLIDANVSAIIGPCYSPAAIAIMPLADLKGVPVMLTTAGGNTFVAPQYMYRGSVPQFGFKVTVVEALVKQGVKTISVVFQNDNDSIVQLWNGTLKPAFLFAGIKVLDEDGVAGTTQDFSAQISKFKANPPDAVGVLVVGGTNVTLVTQIREAGITSSLFGQLAMAAPFFLANTGAAANGTVFAVNFHPGFQFPSSMAFTAAYLAEYGKEPDFAAANGYDATMRVILAIKAADSAIPADIKAALDLQTSMDGAQGPLTFLPDGDTQGLGGVVEVKGDKTETILIGS